MDGFAQVVCLKVVQNDKSKKVHRLWIFLLQK